MKESSEAYRRATTNAGRYALKVLSCDVDDRLKVQLDDIREWAKIDPNIRGAVYKICNTLDQFQEAVKTLYDKEIGI